MGAIDSFFSRAASVIGISRKAPDTAFLQRLVHDAADRLATQRRSFDAAETPAWTDSWKSSGASLNLDLERGLGVLVARSRDHARNNDWARRVLIQFRTNILGPVGMPLQCRMTARGGNPAKALNDMVEKFYRKWCKRGNCEVTGKLSWRGCERVLLDHLVRDGEMLIRLMPGRGPLGFLIQILDPQILDVTYRGNYNGNRIRLGVELDADNRPAAYWIRANADASDYAAVGYGDQRRIRVPAAEMIHFFLPEEADQLRGYPWMTSGARRLWLLKDFEEAAAVASSNAAKRVGFFVSPNGEAPAGFADQIISAAIDAAKASGKQLTAAEIKILTDNAQKFSTAAPGQYDTLPQGYDFKSHDSAYPHINYGEYTKEQVRGFTGGVGISYATGGNNLEAVNFSSARVGILDEREMFKGLQEDIADGLHQRIAEAALKYGLLASPDLARFPANRYEEACDCFIWQKRRWAGIDPVKEANANDTNLKNRLTSPQRIIAERGDDPDDIAEEIKLWEAEFGPLGGNASAPQPDDEKDPADLADDIADGEDESTDENATDAAAKSTAKK